MRNPGRIGHCCVRLAQVGIAALALIAAAVAPGSAQGLCDLGVELSLPNPGGVDGFVPGSLVEATIILQNTSPSFPLQVLDASPGDGNPDITGIDFYPSCTASTDDSPPTACPFDAGEFVGPPPAALPVAAGTIVTAFCGPAANPTRPVDMRINLTHNPGLPLGEKIEFDFIGGLILGPSEVCEFGFQVQVQNFGDPASLSGRNLVFQQANVAGFCLTGGSPLNASGSASAGFEITDLPAPVLSVDKVCDAANLANGTYTYTVSAVNDSPAGNLALEACVIEDPGATCDGALLPDLIAGAAPQSVTCVSSSPENTARVACKVGGRIGVTFEEEAFAACRTCDTVLRRDTNGNTTDFACTERPGVSVSRICDQQDAFGNNAVSIRLENTGDTDLVCQVFDALAGLLLNDVAIPVGGGPLVIPATVSGLTVPTSSEVMVGCVSAVTGAGLPSARATDLCEVDPPSFTLDQVCEDQDALGDNAVTITLTNTGGVDLECQVFDAMAGFLENGVALPAGGPPVVLKPSVVGLAADAPNEVMAGCTVVSSRMALSTRFAAGLCEAAPPSFAVDKICEDQAGGDNAVEITLTNTGGFDLECQVWDPLARFFEDNIALPAGGSSVTLDASVSGLTRDTLSEVMVGCTVTQAQVALPTRMAEDLCLATPPMLEVTKECGADLDSRTGLFVYDVTIANTGPLGAASLVDCEVTDTTAAGCDRNAGEIAAIVPGDSVSLSCTSAFDTNSVSVICKIDGASNRDGSARTVAGSDEAACSDCPPKLTFENLSSGTIVDEQYSARGIHIRTDDPLDHPVMILSTSSPTGGDADLGTPSKNFGGPGEGFGGEFGRPGQNSIPRGKVLIISEDGDSSEPDDDASGGTIIFDFDRAVEVRSVGILDLDDDESGTVTAYDASGAVLAMSFMQALGDNSQQDVLLQVDGVRRIEVEYSSSAAVTDIFFCPEYCVEEAINDVRVQPAPATHAFWLPGIAEDFIFEPSGGFIELEDGTARLTGMIWNRDNPDEAFAVEVGLAGRTPVAPPGGPKRELDPSAYVDRGGPIDPSTWTYYSDFSGTLTGFGDFAGAELMIEPTGPAFQSGKGANNKNTNPGASAWFLWTVLSQPTAGRTLEPTGQGDINIEVLCECV